MNRLAVAALAFAAGAPFVVNAAWSGASEPGACAASSHVVAHAAVGSADIVDTAVAAGNFKTLAAALQAAGLVDTLKGKGPFTVFAPTDEAFGKLPKGTVDTLLKPENKHKLTDILTYHVVAGNAMAKDVVGMKYATTVNGQRVDIKVSGDKVMVDNANVVKTDIVASNGVIHVIDRVIMPADQDIVETAVKNGSFTVLAKALQAAGLVDTLKGKGPFTVFAPTDEAFGKLPPGTVENLLKPENKDQLVKVLTYHVVPKRVYADQVAGMTEGTSVQGSKFKVSAKGGGVMINNANVTAADIEASNGVIHVIDTVLLPK